MEFFFVVILSTRAPSSAWDKLTGDCEDKFSNSHYYKGAKRGVNARNYLLFSFYNIIVFVDNVFVICICR